jgi:hypothetical protein
MPSIEIKNWITGLIVGILGLALTTFGIVLAYKQLRRLERYLDENASGVRALTLVWRDQRITRRGAQWDTERDRGCRGSWRLSRNTDASNR